MASANITDNGNSPDTIHADLSGGRFLVFVLMNVALFVCMLIIVCCLLKSQRDFSTRMNVLRRDRGRRVEKVSERTVFDFHHSPDEAEIVETHDKVMAAFALDDDEPPTSNPLATGGGAKPTKSKRDAGGAKKLSPFEL